MLGAAIANAARSGFKSNPNGSISANDETDTGLMRVPDWVCGALNTDASSISQAQVDSAPISNRYSRCEEKELYPILLDYFAYHAVNVDEEITPADPDTIIDPKSNVRRVTGRLSSLWYAITDFLFSAEDPDEVTDEEESNDDDEEVSDPPKAIFYFGLGNARVKVNEKTVCIVHRSIGPPVGVNGRVMMFKSLHLFAKDNATIQELSDAAFRWDFLRNKTEKVLRTGKYELYTLVVNCGDAYWHSRGHKASRSLESIILPKGMLDAIVEDFREFAADDTENWYLAHGLPHRRSYLFYGPPGVGKTSTIRALAGALELSACFLSLGDAMIGNKEMQDALRNIPKPSMLVIEDIDALFNEKRKAENPSLLTFSGLLNSLDGLVAADGILTVMTTNHIEKLDPALIRAGRVDRKFEFKPPEHDQIRDLFKSFYPNATTELALEFADAVFKRQESDARSIATLQEHFIYTRRKNARESVDALDDFFTMFYPDSKSKDGTVKELQYIA